MGLVSSILWVVGDLTLAVLLFRAGRSSLLSRYSYFYTYVLAVVCSQIVKIYLAVDGGNPRAVVAMWWVLEFVTALAGLGVTWEVYRQTFSHYEGVRRLARGALTAILVSVLVRAGVELSDSPLRNLTPTTLELDRNLRVVQALLLLTITGLIVRYGIPLGRNLWSMLAGYGLLVGSSVITLTLGSQFAHINAWKWWSVPPQIEYCATLVVWCVGLWSYAPNPAPGIALELDYERISAQTTRAFGRLRNHLANPWGD